LWVELERDEDRHDVLRGVDLEIARGERVALMGRNGAGKSTLLRAAAGLVEPVRGKLEVPAGMALLTQNPGDYLVRERVGDELPGDEGAAALRVVGLEHAVADDPRDLSGGERQRLALAIALAGRFEGERLPGLVALDEPTRGMDRGRKDDLVDLMIDHVAGDFLLETVPEDWREALSEIAHRTRAACLQHPWLVAAMDHRPEFGPNAVRHFEQSLAAVSSLDIAPAKALTILRTVDKFTLGQVIDQLSHHAMRRREALTDVEWARAATERLDQLIASGEFPNLARVGSEVAIEAVAHEKSFETFTRDNGAEIVGLPPAEFAAYVASEIERYRQVLPPLGIQVD